MSDYMRQTADAIYEQFKNAAQQSINSGGDCLECQCIWLRAKMSFRRQIEGGLVKFRPRLF